MSLDLVLDGDFRRGQRLSAETELASGEAVQSPGSIGRSSPSLVNAGGSRWRLLWRQISFCWCDPDASPEVSAAYRARQTQALLQQAPLSCFDNVVFSLLIAWLCWNEAIQGLLAIWCGTVWIVSAASVWVWHGCRAGRASVDCVKRGRSLTIGTALIAVLFSVMPTYLFGEADFKGKLILISIVAGFIAHGAVQSARLPIAGITWCIVMCGGTAATLSYLYGDTYSYISWLIIAYCPIICVAVLLASSQFVKNLMAETKIDQQKQLIDILLKDFENDASDWLWETDQHGCLLHASKRLAEVLGVPQDSLKGQRITSALLAGDNLSGSDQPPCWPDALDACFKGSVSFRDIEVLLWHTGEKRWWSLSGKPLVDSGGNIIGWRGVGSDITAERDLQASREIAARVAAELDTARRIQMGLLPDLASLLAGESRFAVAAILEPALQVGGDYYECFALDEKRYCFAVADVSGKGVPASLFMAMTKTLSATLARRSTDLGDAISEISDELNRNNPEMLFVTTFVLVLDAESGELTCVSAGHDAPLLLRDGRVSRLDLGDALAPPMCAIPGYRFQAVKRQLQAGDTLCLFTDGATEATNGSSFYGSRLLIETFSAQPNDASVRMHTDALRQSIREFEAGTPPLDDLTIMILRWHG